ncbi:MAG: hypothetical protein AAF542_17790 [Pseudomonadota bacterium]
MSMTLEQHLLGKLAEEASEVAKIALKAQQFGLHEVREGQSLSNAERIYEELNDLEASVRMLCDNTAFWFEPDEPSIRDKNDRVYKYLRLSVELGQVESSSLDHFQG